MSWERDGTGHVQGMLLENIDGLYGYALILTRNHAEAEDLVQETYLRAIQAMGRLRADSNMKGWLFTILRNVWFNQLRKWRNSPPMIDAGDGDADSIADPSKDSHSLYASKVEAEQVRAAIQKLPVDFREIILLREYEDLSYQEIATVLACPVGTVMSRLGRARAKLRTLLASTMTGPGRFQSERQSLPVEGDRHNRNSGLYSLTSKRMNRGTSLRHRPSLLASTRNLGNKSRNKNRDRAFYLGSTFLLFKRILVSGFRTQTIRRKDIHV
jgi:RNA polymerase sigma-70 factor (ECF subfamily)